MSTQFWTPLFFIVAVLALPFCQAALDPLVCLDQDDALALLNQARPHDALMAYMYGDMTDDAFAAMIQDYQLVRVLDDTSGVLDIRRFCVPSAWRLSGKPIVAFNATGSINCTALNASADTPPPDQVLVLFHILACYQDLIVGDLCASENSAALLVGYSTVTGAPIYVHGCLPGHVCSDTSPDEPLFISTVVAILVVCAGLVVASFVAIRMMRRHLTPVVGEYQLLSVTGPPSGAGGGV